MTTEFTPEEVTRWDDLITRTARFVASDFPGVDRDDLRQELWVWLLEKSNRKAPDAYGVARLVTTIARRMAWRQRAENLQNTSQYDYRRSDLCAILETTFTYNDWEGGFVPKDAQSIDSDVAYDAVDVRMDITWAFEGLSAAHQQALLRRYRDHIEPPAGTRERRALNRAIRSLLDNLNSYYRLNPRRKAISNATARYTIENQEG